MSERIKLLVSEAIKAAEERPDDWFEIGTWGSEGQLTGYLLGDVGPPRTLLYFDGRLAVYVNRASDAGRTARHNVKTTWWQRRRLRAAFQELSCERALRAIARQA